MKKIISLIISLLLISSYLFMNVSAAEKISFSDDLKELYYGDRTYYRFDISLFADFETLDLKDYDFAWDEDNGKLKREYFVADNEKIVIHSVLDYSDGSSFTAGFLREDYYEIYYNLSNKDFGECEIDFQWPEGNIVKTKRDLLSSGAEATLNTLEIDEWYNVNVSLKDSELKIEKGIFIVQGDDYYYLDYEKHNVTESIYDYLESNSKVKVYRIDDRELSLSIEEGLEEYYADDLGFLYDDNFTKTVSNILTIFLFVIIPVIILGVFVILAIRSKTYYKKFFRTVYCLAAAELVIFAVVATILF